MKYLLQKILRILAKLILNKYHPEIIGITGSVGKTGAKEAIFSVLSPKFNVRKNIKNYNNEIGVPLTIIGAESPRSSFFGWLKVIIKAIKLLIIADKKYPKILIIEMAADKPGDIDYLSGIVKCRIGVITSIGDSHLENFKTLENIKEEKAALIKKMDKKGWAVLNMDEERIKGLRRETKMKTMTYAINYDADVMAKEIRVKLPVGNVNAGEFGISYKLMNNGSFAPVFLPDCASYAGVYASLAGATVGAIKGLNLVEISQALKSFKTVNGRMKILAGVKNTLVIDDTYNSSPASSALALETLGKILTKPKAYKYAVLGDMLELGHLSVKGHEQAGQAVVKNKIDKLIVVGERSRDIARGAEAAGMSRDDIFHFAAAKEAAVFIKERIKNNDIILVKGSQSSRMEKIVKEIMAEPARAAELLVRQGREWEK